MTVVPLRSGLAAHPFARMGHPRHAALAVSVGSGPNVMPGAGEVGAVYVGSSRKTLSAKEWSTTTDHIGVGDSFLGFAGRCTSGSSYFELNGTYDLGGGRGALAHVGLQSIRSHAPFVDVQGNTLGKNVTDWKVGATKDLSGFVVGLAVAGTSRENYFGTATSLKAGGNTRGLASFSKTS